MRSFLKLLIRNNPTHDCADMLRMGFYVLDVRTPAEFAGGQVQGSRNVPIQLLERSLDQLPTSSTIVSCCTSGARSGIACALSKQRGMNAINAGLWLSV